MRFHPRVAAAAMRKPKYQGSNLWYAVVTPMEALYLIQLGAKPNNEHYSKERWLADKRRGRTVCHGQATFWFSAHGQLALRLGQL